jgi:TCP-1/cpn60 chaperonin family
MLYIRIIDKSVYSVKKNMILFNNKICTGIKNNNIERFRTQNVMAASSIANIVKSSLGPVGLDKMLVDDIGDVTITNDGATILQLLEVEHPAAKVLVELAALQDEEVGYLRTGSAHLKSVLRSRILYMRRRLRAKILIRLWLIPYYKAGQKF